MIEEKMVCKNCLQAENASIAPSKAASWVATAGENQ